MNSIFLLQIINWVFIITDPRSYLCIILSFLDDTYCFCCRWTYKTFPERIPALDDNCSHQWIYYISILIAITRSRIRLYNMCILSEIKNKIAWKKKRRGTSLWAMICSVIFKYIFSILIPKKYWKSSNLATLHP